jgi:hypothetical protein
MEFSVPTGRAPGVGAVRISGQSEEVHLSQVFPPNTFCRAKYSDVLRTKDTNVDVLLTQECETFRLLITSNDPVIHLSFILSKDSLVNGHQISIPQSLSDFSCTLNVF